VDIVEIPLFHLGDGTNLANKAKVDSSGNLYTSTVISNTVAVSGNLGVAISTGTNSIGSISNTGFNVNNFPATQAVSGTITVGTLPALPTGANTIGAVNINGTVPFSFAGTMPVSGTVSVTNFPSAFQVSNFPATQNVDIVSGSIANTGFNVTGSLPAGTNVIGHVISDTGSTTVVTALPALPTGANSIGTVGLNAGVASVGTVGLNAGTNVAGKFGIDQTTPGTTNAVQLTGPGTTLANPIFVSTESGVAAVLKTSGQLTSVSLAAGASITLSAPFVTATKQGTLKHVDASSSVPIKVELQSVNNASVATSIITRFTSSYNLFSEWREYITGEFLGIAAANGTAACFAVKITNMDPQANAADVFATLAWTES
jgi:hypothetical protein